MSVKIIKAKPGVELSRAVRIPKAVMDASLEAKETINKARDEAEAIVFAAQTEKENIFAESRRRGYAEGLDQWNEALAEALIARERYLVQNETVLVQVAMAVARKIVGDAVNLDASVSLHAARQAIRSVRGEQKIKLRVRPEDESVVREQSIELKRANAEIGEILVVADESITLGGCVVESPIGTVDAQFSTQLQSLERALLRGGNATGH